jgi:CRP/FNR family transcriptional regulator, cyclic AMP receptor protein
VRAESVPAPAVEHATAGGAPSTVRLLSVDAGLRAAVPADDRRLAERVLVVPYREFEAGSWSPEALLDDSARPLAALLLRGVVMHELMLAGRRSANVLGPGDLFRPWRSADTAVPCASSWSTGGGAAMAVLDGRFLTAARRWPGLSAVVYERLAEQLETAEVRAAITALPRVEERVLALFWLLADRWGVVRPEGVVVELALTHALIGHLVGAQRPTVSLALQALAEDRLLRRAETDAWVLGHDSYAVLGAGSDRPFGDGPAACARRLARPPRRSDADRGVRLVIDRPSNRPAL